MFTKKVSARLLTVAGATALVLGAMSGAQAASPQTANLTVQATVSSRVLTFFMNMITPNSQMGA